MVRTIEGTYKEGKVELSEKPAGVDQARVLVVFLPETEASRSVEAREHALKRLVERAEKGFDLGGPPYPKREELYDRFDKHE